MVLQDALQGIQENITCFEMVKTSVASSALCHYKCTFVNSVLHPLEAKAGGQPNFRLQLPSEEVDLPQCCKPRHLLLPRAAAEPPEGLHPGLRSAMACCRSHPALGELFVSPGTPPSPFCCEELLDGELFPTFSPST